MKLRQKDSFSYKGWRVDKMEANQTPIVWVACKHWKHTALGTFRSVTISSFDQIAKIRDYVKIMNTVLKGFEIDPETDMGKH